MNSRNKGKVGERELAKVLQGYGYDTRRGQQYAGANGDADVVGIQGLHIECKRCQQVRDEEFLQQSEKDARESELPVVIYRRNREQWKVTMRLDTFIKLWRAYEKNLKKIRKKDKIGKSAY